MERVDCPVRGAAVGLRGEPHAKPGNRRGRGAGDVRGLSDQLAQLRSATPAGRLPVLHRSASGNSWEPAGKARRASSIARSSERRALEESALEAAIGQQIERWHGRGQWEKLKCAELLFVRGQTNKDAAVKLKLSEQTVANHKYEFLSKLRDAVRKQGLPEDVFPELYQ